MARSAVVTFMEDGRIVISNQKAEELLGLSRQALLGENIFKFIEKGEALRSALSADLRDGKWELHREVTRHTIRNFQGEAVEVDMALSVSRTGEDFMFTAILRKLTKIEE